MDGYPIKANARFALQGKAPKPLGYRQFQIVNYVFAYFAQHNIGPIYEQICEATGIGTHGEVSRAVTALEKLGLMTRSGRGSARRITQVANQSPDRPGVEL